MKSFSQFWEEASLSDLQKQKRMKQVEDARRQSASRRSSAQRFTKRNKQKALSKQQEAQERLAQQQEKAQRLKAKRVAQQQQARKKARATAHNVTTAVKGTAELSGKLVKAVTNRKKPQPNSQSGT